MLYSEHEINDVFGHVIDLDTNDNRALHNKTRSEQFTDAILEKNKLGILSVTITHKLQVR